MVSSAISTNSRSRICLTTLLGREAAGLNGPLVASAEVLANAEVLASTGVVARAEVLADSPSREGLAAADTDAAAASKSRPDVVGWLGENRGSEKTAWLATRGAGGEPVN